MDAQTLRAETFKALHERDHAFVMPNPWDAGSAIMLASSGFEAPPPPAPATRSAWGARMPKGRCPWKTPCQCRNDRQGHGVASGRRPGKRLQRHPRRLRPDHFAARRCLRYRRRLHRRCHGYRRRPIYPFERSVERVEAAVAAARSLPFRFMLTARAENLLHGRLDLPDTIRRLQAYAEAGADVLYAPGLRSAEEVLAVVKAVAPKPVNVLMSGGLKLSVAQLSAMGVKRISVGSAMALAAYGEFYRAAQEVYESGTFTFTERSMPYSQASQFFKD